MKAEEIRFSVLATGDMHSHFEPNEGPYRLGGAARLKTAMDRIEKNLNAEGRPVLRLDAGDCGEGSIYFNVRDDHDEVAGVAAYELLNRLNYHAVVLGNHDWSLGPRQLFQVLEKVPPRFSYLSANLNWDNFKENYALKEKFKDHEIFYLVNGQFLRKGDLHKSGDALAPFQPAEDKTYFKVGIFGLSTDEEAYAFLFRSVGIEKPAQKFREAVQSLKKENVDVIIMLSHMLDRADESIAERSRYIDLIVGGHSHNKIQPYLDENNMGAPIMIERMNKDKPINRVGIVKTGEYGQYLGQIDLVFDTELEYGSKRGMISWQKSNYQLHQLDEKIEPDPDIDRFVQEQKKGIIERYFKKNHYGKNIFSDDIGSAEVDLFRSIATESYLGNLVVNAIYEKGKLNKADFAVSNSQFLSSNLYRGPIHSATLYDLFSLIYDPLKDQSWRVWTFKMNSKMLKAAIRYTLLNGYFLDVAGLEIVYDPERPFEEKIVSLRWPNGEELLDDDTRMYKVAASQGIIDAIKIMEGVFSDVKIIEAEDTGMEIWHAIRDYIQYKKVLKADDPDIQVSGRVKTVQPDLAVLSEDIRVAVPDGDHPKWFEITLPVRNLGLSTAQPTDITFFYDRTPENTMDDVSVLKPDKDFFSEPIRKKWMPTLEDLPKNIVKIATQPVDSIAPSREKNITIRWKADELPAGGYPYLIYAWLGASDGEKNLYNNKAMAFVDIR